MFDNFKGTGHRSVLPLAAALAAAQGIAQSPAWAAETATVAPARPAEADALPELSPEELQAIQAAFGDHPPEATTAPPPPPAAAGPATGALNALASTLQSMNPDLSFILDAALGYFSDTPRQTGGHDPNRTGFTFQQLELAVSASVDPFLRFDANIVLSQFGLEVEEAYATSLGLPAQLQLRAGQFLTPFGRQNPTHPHTWSFMDQPLVLGKFFGSEGSRGLGLEGSWLTPLPWYVELKLAANEAGGACCARSFFGAQDLGVRTPADFVYTGRVEQFFPFDDDWSLLLGVSGQVGPNPTGNGNRTGIYGVDLYLRYRPVDSTLRSTVTLTVEGLYRTRQVPDDRLVDVGGYAQLVWEFALQWALGARYEYVAGVANDPLDLDWDRARHRVSLQATYYPSHFSRVRIQGNYDDPLYADGPIWAALINLEVVVGAHGSHAF